MHLGFLLFPSFHLSFKAFSLFILFHLKHLKIYLSLSCEMKESTSFCLSVCWEARLWQRRKNQSLLSTWIQPGTVSCLFPVLCVWLCDQPGRWDVLSLLSLSCGDFELFVSVFYRKFYNLVSRLNSVKSFSFQWIFKSMNLCVMNFSKTSRLPWCSHVHKKQIFFHWVSELFIWLIQSDLWMNHLDSHSLGKPENIRESQKCDFQD